MKQFGSGMALITGGYLLLAILIITIQVVWSNAPVLQLAYRLGTLAYVFGSFYVGVKTIEKKHIALLVALVAALAGILAVFVIGVNFGLMIGGSL